MAEPKRALQTDIIKQVLPLVLEIIPGQAAEGLVDIYEPGSYEGQSLWKLCEKTLSKKDWSIEEQQVVEDIKRQLDGGRLLCRGQQLERAAWATRPSRKQRRGRSICMCPSGPSSPKKGEGWRIRGVAMEKPERKKWDPDCPRCREELERALELAAGIYDEVDHGGGLYRIRPPEYCDHENPPHPSPPPRLGEGQGGGG